MIFLIDDDPSVQKAFSLLLRSAGFDVKAFASAKDFLTYSLLRDDDCIILDLHMPEMNGFDLMSTLLARGSHTPVICITAFDSATSRERVRELGGAAYFTKPVDDQALIDAIKWAMQSEKRDKRLRQSA